MELFILKGLQYHIACGNIVTVNKENKMVINVIQIKSEFPLGTTDGIAYTIVPRA